MLACAMALVQAAAPTAPCAESLRPVQTLIQTSQSALRAAAGRAGGLLEVHHNRKVRLFVDGAGHLFYRKIGAGAGKAARVRWWGHFQRKNLPDLSVEQLGARLRRVLAARPDGQARGRSNGCPWLRAILPDGRDVDPDHYLGGFHGTCQVAPSVALKRGLPRRGGDWRLKEHAEQSFCSAFRGCTLVVSDPVTGNGAAYWAGEGGWVYEIRGVPSWDVNVQLEGRVRTPIGTYRGNLMHGEQEIAVPAQVPSQRIKAYGRVVADGAGRLAVRDWIPNPAYRERR